MVMNFVENSKVPGLWRKGGWVGGILRILGMKKIWKGRGLGGLEGGCGICKENLSTFVHMELTRTTWGVLVTFAAYLTYGSHENSHWV